MNDIENEILLIAQEECAEVVQAISKVFRFGIDGKHLDVTNRTHLEEECGDLLCMIYLMIDKNIIGENETYQAATNKKDKLVKWSGIFKEEKVESI
jgi:NTP pyrophosphatase (non-canonical NTP hydrolase)